MEWVEPFFDQASRWWGRPTPRPSDQERAETVRRWVGHAPLQILELGAGGGTTAIATAQQGHTVVAIELSSARVGYARDLETEHPELHVAFVHGNFYDVTLDGQFDCVTYWNGFGVGTDEDQRRLLQRVTSEWLTDTGVMVLDVFSPWRWARDAGSVRVERHAVELVNSRDYDPVTSRFEDTWWPVGREVDAISQSARCYAPSDLSLLLDGTGLRIAAAEVAGEPIDLDNLAGAAAALWDAWEYRVLLVRAGSRARRSKAVGDG